MQTEITEEAKTTEHRPFHETIIDAIRSASSIDLECLASLIRATKIPKNHDEIAAAWKQRTKEMGWGSNSPDVAGDVLSQKQEIEKQLKAWP